MRAGGSGVDLAGRMVLGSGGTATLSGVFFSPTLSFGPTTLTNAGSGGTTTDIFIARLSSAGVWTQAVSAGGTGDDWSEGVAIDTRGNTWLGGRFYSPTASFGATTLANANSSGATSDAFVARWTSAGTWDQVVRAGGSGDDEVSGLALDAAGTAVAVGVFSGPSATFGPVTLTNADPSGATWDVVVARLSSTGTWMQAVAAGGGKDEFPNCLAVAPNGNVVVGGLFTGLASRFGAQTLGTATGSGFVAQLTGLVTAARPARSNVALTVVPNPAHHRVQLQWEGAAMPEPILVRLLDALGREHLRQLLPPRAQRVDLDLAGLSAGVYVVHLATPAGALATQRLIVQ